MCVFVDKCVVWCIVVMISKVVCNPVMSNFNKSIRDFSTPEDNINSTSVRTLQKEEFARYANFAPIQSPIKFKEIPDNVLSSSTHHGRGLLHHDHNGYGLDYDDNQHYGHGVDYHLHDTHLLDPHHIGHGYGLHLGYGLHGHGSHDHHHNDHHDHHNDHHDHHKDHYDHHKDHYDHHKDHYDVHGHHDTHLYYGDHGHDHHKHLAHALAAKTVLWPIAGIALLGAAAALVTNPVLLQLGVVSGRRKREAQDTTDFDPDSLKKWLTKNRLMVEKRTSANSVKRIEEDSVKVIRPLDNHNSEGNTGDDFSNNQRKAENIDDVLKRRRISRLINVNKRTIFRKPAATSANPPRTETDEDKHYIAIPLLTNS